MTNNLGSSLIICGGWLELWFIYNSLSFGLYMPLFRLNVISKKSTFFELVSMSMLNISLNILIHIYI